jgi:hypothetical protein
MATLKPFRDYDEKDVINLYAYEGTIPVNRGTLVKINGNGWTSTDELQMLGNLGKEFGNTVSTRYGVAARVEDAGAGDSPLGMLLYDVKETDENGELLKFNPRKAHEMEVALSGQAVPLVTRGIFLYSGSTMSAETPTAGQALYCGAGGEMTTGVGSNVQVGVSLGVKDTHGHILIKLNL